MQKGSNTTEISGVTVLLTYIQTRLRIYLDTNIYLGKCPKPDRNDNVLYAIAVADWYFNVVCYRIMLAYFWKEPGILNEYLPMVNFSSLL